MACKRVRMMDGKPEDKRDDKPEGRQVDKPEDKRVGNRSLQVRKPELGCSKLVVVRKPELGCSKPAEEHRREGKRVGKPEGKQVYKPVDMLDGKPVDRLDGKQEGKRACKRVPAATSPTVWFGASSRRILK